MVWFFWFATALSVFFYLIHGWTRAGRRQRIATALSVESDANTPVALPHAVDDHHRAMVPTLALH